MKSSFNEFRLTPKTCRRLFEITRALLMFTKNKRDEKKTNMKTSNEIDEKKKQSTTTNMKNKHEMERFQSEQIKESVKQLL